MSRSAWEADSFLASQQTFHPIRNSEFHYSVHNFPSMDTDLNRVKPVPTNSHSVPLKSTFKLPLRLKSRKPPLSLRAKIVTEIWDSKATNTDIAVFRDVEPLVDINRRFRRAYDLHHYLRQSQYRVRKLLWNVDQYLPEDNYNYFPWFSESSHVNARIFLRRSYGHLLTNTYQFIILERLPIIRRYMKSTADVASLN